MTLNQIADRIARLVNQPFNHNLRERIKDMVKGLYANRIRQSVQKHGIDELLKINYKASLILVSETDDKVVVITDRIPVPVRINNDSPFTNLLLEGDRYVQHNGTSANRPLHNPFPTGVLASSNLINGKLQVTILKDDYYKSIPTFIEIESIFENPEEALIGSADGQDTILPLPSDMLESIIQEILKTEFNIIPKDDIIDITLNTKR